MQFSSLASQEVLFHYISTPRNVTWAICDRCRVVARLIDLNNSKSFGSFGKISARVFGDQYQRREKFKKPNWFLNHRQTISEESRVGDFNFMSLLPTSVIFVKKIQSAPMQSLPNFPSFFLLKIFY